MNKKNTIKGVKAWAMIKNNEVAMFGGSRKSLLLISYDKKFFSPLKDFSDECELTEVLITPITKVGKNKVEK